MDFTSERQSVSTETTNKHKNATHTLTNAAGHSAFPASADVLTSSYHGFHGNELHLL